MDEPRVTHSSPARDDAIEILVALRRAGHDALLAGGCVRDELLGLTPSDYDVATSATPDDVRRIFPKAQGVGAAFGVMLVRHRSSVVEVATFRSDGHYADGRRPSSVTFSDARHDAMRRDFTVNALFLDPIDNRVIDHVGGRDDLARRILRAVGEPELRFAEDYLRMLRAIRFAARFDLTIEPRTFAQLSRHASMITRIAPERVGDELRTMLEAPTRHRAIDLLKSTGLERVLLRMLGAAGPALTTDALVTHALPAEPVPFPMVLAAWFTDARRSLGKQEAGELFSSRAATEALRAARTTFRTSNEEAELLRACIELEPLIGKLEPTLAQKMRFLARPDSGAVRKMLGALERAGVLRERIVRLEADLNALDPERCAQSPWVSGDDLVAMGFSPGPAFKRVLDEVYDLQLEARVTTRDQALVEARERMNTHASNPDLQDAGRTRQSRA